MKQAYRLNLLLTVYGVGALCAVLCLRKQPVAAVGLSLCTWLLAGAWKRVREEI